MSTRNRSGNSPPRARREALLFVRQRGDRRWVVYPSAFQYALEEAYMEGHNTMTIELPHGRLMQVDFEMMRETRYNPRGAALVAPVIRNIDIMRLEEGDRDAEILLADEAALMDGDILAYDDNDSNATLAEVGHVASVDRSGGYNDAGYAVPSSSAQGRASRTPVRPNAQFAHVGHSAQWLSNQPFSSAPVTPLQPAVRAPRILPQPLQPARLLFEFAPVGTNDNSNLWRSFSDADSRTLARLIALRPTNIQQIALGNERYFIDVPNRTMTSITRPGDQSIFRYFELLRQ